MPDSSTSQPNTVTEHATKRLPSSTAQPESGLSMDPHRNSRTLQCIEISKAVTTLAKNAAGNVDMPDLTIGLNVFMEILNQVQKINADIGGIDIFLARVQELVRILEENMASRANGREHFENVQQRIESLMKTWKAITQDLAQAEGWNAVVESLRVGVDRERLALLVRRIDASIRDFFIAAPKQDDFILPKGARNARHDSSGGRRSCFPGTRTGALDRLRQWVAIACTQKQLLGQVFWVTGSAGSGKTTVAYSIAEECCQKGLLSGSFFCAHIDSECSDPNFIFTTLAHQLCNIDPSFKRRVSDILRNEPDLVDAGPSRQLEELIVKPLEQMKSANNPFPTCIIVLDAIDECRNEGISCSEDVVVRPWHRSSTSIILSVLARFIPRLAPLLFIITGRPDSHVIPLFEESHKELKSLHGGISQFSLQEVHLGSSLDDIELYLTKELCNFSRKHHMPEGWPSTHRIHILTELSGGLWIYAATAVRFICHDDFPDPENRLELLIRQRITSAKPIDTLHFLYSQVINALHKTIAAPLATRLSSILGTIALSQEALSVPSLAALIDIQEDALRLSLKGLQPVLCIPPPGSSQVIHAFHLTFSEYLTIHASSQEDAFHIAPREQHRYLFTRCLKTMDANLCYDIIKLCDPACLKTEVDLTDKVRRHIPAQWSYAVRFWSVHLTSGGLGGDNIVLFQEFLEKHLLHWLESCSVLDAFDIAISSLEAARHAVQDSKVTSTNMLLPLLNDAYRFASAYATPINAAPLQVYHSALGLAPRRSLVAQTYSGQRLHRESLVVCQGAIREWKTCIDVLEEAGAQCAAFSPDNAFFISGGHDEVKIWRTSTRALALRIQTSGGPTWDVAYSPDGEYVVVGGKRMLDIWDAASGTRVRTITTDDAIAYLAYAAHGGCLLFISVIGTVQLWRVSDGACLFSRAEGGLFQAGVTPDGAVIARTRGTSLLLYNVSSGAHEELELPSWGRSTTFSPDGRYVAAATRELLLIWSYPDNSLVRSIKVPEEVSSKLAFSKDGSKICYGCWNGSVYIWEVEGNGPAREMKGHTSRVHSVAWSSDSFQIISTEVTGAIRLWDIAHHPSIEQSPVDASPSENSPRTPRNVIVASDHDVTVLDIPPIIVIGSPIPPTRNLPARDGPSLFFHPSRAVAWSYIVASTSIDISQQKSSYLWASLTGQQQSSINNSTAVSQDGTIATYQLDDTICFLSVLLGVATVKPEPGQVSSMSFSSDDALFAAASGNPGVVEVWDVKTGDRITCHRGHSRTVASLAFSSNGRLIVSGSADETAQIFDITAKHLVRSLGPHDRSVQRATFTRDDTLVVVQDDQGAVYVWDAETGYRVYTFSGSWWASDEWIQSLHFSSDGLLVPTNDGERTAALWKLGDRAWPVYLISKDGWLFAKGPGYTHRLAWLPIEWSQPVYSAGQVFCVCEETKTEARRLIEIDMSQLLDYVGIPYTK